MYRQLAAYASHADASRGRLYDEPASRTRTAFQRDRDRVVHASAFRRLEHKTQVFIAHTGDSYRTRLTHSLEVAQVARSLARELRLDEDLSETLALAHDLGHTPFGHAGEEALHAQMQDYDGFDHNAQSLRILTKLEQRYIGFDGLNLTWETLEGLAKHNGPLLTDGKQLSDLPFAMRDYVTQHNLELASWASAEAQVAALADDIAYHNHDLDDGLRAGLFGLDDLTALPLIGDIIHTIKQEHGTVAPRRFRNEMIRKMISAMIADLVTETEKRLAELRPQSVHDIRHADYAVVGFSPEMQKNNKAIKRFLHEAMYRQHEVNRSMSKAKRMVSDLFQLYMAEPTLLPESWQTKSNNKIEVARRICDYIAGMTDRFAIQEYRRLFEISNELV